MEPISGAAEWSCPSRTAHHTLTDPLLCWLWLHRGIVACLEKGSAAVKSEKTEPRKQVQEFRTQGENIQRLEGKGEWIQEREVTGRKTDHRIDINLSSFSVQTNHQNKLTKLGPNR